MAIPKLPISTAQYIHIHLLPLINSTDHMAILHHHNCLLNPSHHATTTKHRYYIIARVDTPLNTPLKSKPDTKQQLAINPPQLPPRVPPLKAPTPNDPSLKSTLPHRLWVASGCTTLLVSLAKSIIAAATISHSLYDPAIAGLVGYFLADLGSGVYHWGIDNFGSASTPIFGGQIEAFQGHHKWPWTITKRQFANNLHALARVITFTVLPFDLVCNEPIVLGFVSIFAGCIMFSQQFHAWAHSTKSKLPPFVAALQDLGVLVSRSQHAAHHHPPYNNNYCIVSGVWNKFLDDNKVFEALEMILFFQLGLYPRSWSDPSSEWTEEVVPSSSQALTK